MTECRAQMRWMTAAEGGRARPPTGPRYSAVARFEKLKDLWPAEAWSVVIYIGEDSVNVLVSPLVDSAPADLFVAGSRFDLFEGDSKVAEGQIV